MNSLGLCLAREQSENDQMDTQAQNEISLPEYLFLLNLGKSESTFDPYYILALLLDLANHDIISLKPKTTWLLKEKQVITLTNPSFVSTNPVLELMLDRLKNQKHDHSVQQWADHWIGNTWKELLFPQHPIQTLKATITKRLEEQELIKNNQLTEAGSKQIEEFKQQAMANTKGKPMLLLVLNPAFQGFLSAPVTVDNIIQSDSFSSQTKEVLKEIQIYLSTH